MKFIIPLIALLLAGCAVPTAELTEDGASVGLAPVATLARVKAGEALALEYADTLAEGQTALAVKIGDEITAAQAQAAKDKAALDAAIMSAKDEASNDWVYLVGAALTAMGIPVAASRKRRGVFPFKQANPAAPDPTPSV